MILYYEIMWFSRFIKDESGQAVLEFLLALLAVISIVGLMKSFLKVLTAKLWSLFAKKIAAPCVACDAGAEFDL
ncbi:MAG: hypothetical protein M9962_04980 [Oligoflexia bacterium]|nr:hypothetical protein [Oligoflexia bacterium]